MTEMTDQANRPTPMLAIQRDANDLVTRATKAAKSMMGRAWDSMPHMREAAVASELLRCMSCKDQDAATAKTAAVLIAAAAIVTANSVTS